MRGKRILTAALCFTLMSAASAFAGFGMPAPPTSSGTPNTAPPAAPPPQSQSSPPAPGHPTINIKIDPAVQKLDAAYNEALKTLSPEQLATLKAIDADFGKTMDADTNIIILGQQVAYCSAKDEAFTKDKAKYQSEFGVFRSQAQAAQRTQRDTLFAAAVAQAPFIDKKALEDHEKYTSTVMSGTAYGLMQASAQMGGFNKTDCRDVAQKLDASFAKANTAPDAPSESFKAGTEARIAQIKAAAEAGNPDAMTSFAMLEIAGNNVPKDVPGGMAMLEKAAATGYDRAEYILGLAYTSQMLGAPDMEKAKNWLGKAAAQGDKKAENTLRQLQTAPPPDSPETIRKKAEAGNAPAEYSLASNYLYGWGGLEKNHAEAMKWLLLSAGQGYPLAQSDVAVQLFGENKTSEGLDWMTKAATNGVTNSQVELAAIYLDGKLVPKDRDKALFWYRKAADGGDQRAAEMVRKLAP